MVEEEGLFIVEELKSLKTYEELDWGVGRGKDLKY
jgi:hypothetical protein